MLRKIYLTTIILFVTSLLWAQKPTGGVTGTVINRLDRTPVTNAQLVLKQNNGQIANTTTNAEGKFTIGELEDGIYDLIINAAGFLESRVNVTVNDGYVKDLFNLSLTPSQVVQETDEADFEDFDMEDSGYNDNPTILYSQNDVFNDITSFGWSSVRYRGRGFTGESQDVYLAGIKMNDAITGYSPFSLWTGLNEAVRTKFSTIGSEISNYGFGGYNGLTNIPGNASNVRKGLRGSVLTNSASYRLRLMLTYASGELDNGWSYALSASARLGGNDWIKGVYYNSFAYYASVEKRFSTAHKLGLTFMATPGRRGAQNGSTQEVYDLLGDNMYNSNWGYQKGKRRNARERITHEPIAIFKYDYTPSHKFNASFTTLYRFGKNGYTALDWYDAPDPRPDYYKNLPSYFYMENSDYNRLNYSKYLWAKESWEKEYSNVAHIDWDRLYNVNYKNIDTYGRRSKYIIEERRVDQKDLNFGANFKWVVNNWLSIIGGANYKWNKTHNYKIVKDLLGGEYFVNIDSFAERDYASNDAFIQNDLNYFLNNGQAQILYKGDKFGYNYDANIRNAAGWLNFKFQVGGLEANLAGRVAYTKFWRDGKYRKGLFAGLNDYNEPIYYQGVMITSYDAQGEPITSYGESEKVHFTLYSAKTNLIYSFLGGHRVSLNGAFIQDAPYFNKTFVSPRTRNTIIPYLEKTKIYSTDLNYLFTNGGVSAKVTGFFAQIKDQTDVMSFYDDSQNSFTNFAMRGIDEQHVGVEVGLKFPTPIPNLSFEGAFAWGQYIYTSNPTMTQTMDNSTEIIYQNVKVPYWMSHPVFKRDEDGNYVTDEYGEYVVDKFQKHYVSGTPQLAFSLGLSYFYNYWFIDFNANFFDRSYLSMNPLYRTDVATAGPDKIVTPSEIEYMAKQEKFKSAWILNLSIGKSWYIQRKYQIGCSFNLNNLTNNKKVKTGGYEQTRFVDNTTSKERYYRFDSKYFYMAGLNYMLNVYFRF